MNQKGKMYDVDLKNKSKNKKKKTIKQNQFNINENIVQNNSHDENSEDDLASDQDPDVISTINKSLVNQSNHIPNSNIAADLNESEPMDIDSGNRSILSDNGCKGPYNSSVQNNPQVFENQGSVVLSPNQSFQQQQQKQQIFQENEDTKQIQVNAYLKESRDMQAQKREEIQGKIDTQVILKEQILSSTQGQSQRGQHNYSQLSLQHANQVSQSFLSSPYNMNRNQIHQETVTLRFYCHHTSIHKYPDFWLELCVEDKDKSFTKFPMKQVGIPYMDDIIYVDIPMNMNHWEGKNLVYRYVIKKFMQSETYYIKRHYSQFKDQRVFYDTPQVFYNKFKNKDSEPYLSIYYSLILNSYNYGNKVHGNLEVLDQLLIFQKNLSYAIKLEVLFKQMQNTLLNQSCHEEFLKFCFSIVGFLHQKQPEIKNEAKMYHLPLCKTLNQMNLKIHERLDISYLRRDLESFLKNELKEVEFMNQGLKTLTNVNPIFAINYISNQNVVKDPKEIFILIVNLAEDPTTFSMLQRVVSNQIYIRIETELISFLSQKILQCARSLNDILILDEYVLTHLKTEDLIEKIRIVKNAQFKRDDLGYSYWIYTNLDCLLENSFLKPMFQEEISQSVLGNSHKPEFIQRFGNVLKDHPDLINAAVIHDFAQNIYEYNDFQKMLTLENLYASKISVISYFDERVIIQKYCEQIAELLNSPKLKDIVQQLAQYFNCMTQFSTHQRHCLESFNVVVAQSILNKVGDSDEIYKIVSQLIDKQSHRLINEGLYPIVYNLMEEADNYFSQEEVEQLLQDVNFMKMISYGDQDSRFIMKLTSNKFQKMYNELKQGSFTIKSIKPFFTTQYFRNFQMVFRMTVPEFENKVLVHIQESFKVFKLETDRYETFQLTLLDLSELVDSDLYNQHLEEFVKEFENVPIKLLNQQRDKKFFLSLKSIAIDYQFKDSTVYNNLSRQYFSQEYINQLKTQQINQQNLNQDMDQDISEVKLSVKKFDKIYYEKFLMKQLKQYITQLQNYPDKNLNFIDLSCWDNIKPNKIQQEVDILFKNNPANEEEQNIEINNCQLIQHLQQFTQMNSIIEKCQILTSIGFLGVYYKLQKSDKSQEIIEQFVAFHNAISTKSLLEISVKLSQVSTLLNFLIESYQIDFQKLALLKGSSELIEFCQKNENIDYSDLNDGLDDDTLLDNSILQDMVQINRFCQDLIKGMLQNNKQKENTYSQFLTYIQETISIHEQNDKNFQFNLSNCIRDLQIIKTFCDTQVNSQENTLKIVLQIMFDGQAEFKIEGERCKFQINYDRNKSIDNDKINQYSARAILLSHNKRSDDIEKDDNIKIADQFAQKVKIFQDIKKIITELSLNGHLNFQSQQYQQQYEIPDCNIEDLQEELNGLTSQLKSWKELLLDLRMEFYYMTMVPNSKIQYLSKYFVNPCNENLEFIESVFRFINPDIDVQSLIGRMPSINDDEEGNKETIKQCSKQLNEIFFKNQYKTEKMFYENGLNELRKKVMLLGEVQIYQVTRDIDNIKAIASIFSVCKFYPQMSQLMFCNKKTKLYEVECFIMRAILFPNDKNEQRVFILSNFQKLQLQIQDDALKFLDQMKELAQTKNLKKYILIILQTVSENMNEFLIEQMQGKPSFTPFIVEEIYLKRFFNCPNAHLITSQRAGLGKSTFIRNAIQQSNCQYVNIPFQGDLSKDKIIKIHQRKLSWKHGSIGLHYVVNPSQGEDLNIILFELLIFQGINDYDNQIYQFSDQITIFIEFSQDIRLNHEDKYFLNLIGNKKELEWSLDRVIVNKQPNSYSQIVLKSIRLVNLQAFDWEYVNDESEVIQDQEAQELLGDYYLNEISEPNFFMIDQFIAFAGDQLEQMRKSGFFSLAYFEAQFEDQAMEFLINFVEQMLLFSKNLCIMTRSMANQKLSIDQNKVGQLGIIQGINEVNWSLQDSAFVTFNSDGTVTPIFRNPEDLPLSILAYYKILIQVMTQNQSDQSKIDDIVREVSSFEKLTQEQVVERIFKICGRDYKQFNQLPKKSVQRFDQFRLAFTADNFLKMNLIYLRLRSCQLVTIMGETGVGKTALIEYLKDVLCWDYRKLNIHEGVTEVQIKEFVLDANLLQDKRVILFFDEVNTNFNVSGLLKEIMVDRTVEGAKFGDHIRIVAACNPYKLKIENQQQNERRFTSGIKHYRINQLADNVVYRVHPLPESVFPSVQDYGALKLEEQQIYINKIIQRINKFTNVFYSDEMIQFISAIVFESHVFIQQKSTVSSVSLRDVDRFKKLFKYFYLDNSARDDPDFKIDEFEMMMRVLVLTMTVCYKLSLDSKELRKEYDERILQVNVEGFHLRASQLKYYLDDEEDRYINKMEIPLGIGINDSLKENVFAIITMIRNKIPLFITGKPGSSKTLAMNLVLKSMRGKSSQNDFFKRFPAIQQVNYQGSIQSTSSGIERIFDRAYKSYEEHEKKMKEQNIKEPSVIIVVIIDEIGLAELSPHNPLKVLHAYLEMFKVGFVGISNWSLDDSKRNRGINLSKPEPNDDDLIQSADSQFSEICCRDRTNQSYRQNNKRNNSQIYNHFKQNILNKLVQFYQKYYNNQITPNFHGLRDFYQLVCYVSYRMKNQQNAYTSIAEGVQRNFGGQNMEKVMNYLKAEFVDEEEIQNYVKLQSSHLIQENLSDKLARNLMIISDHQETITLRYIEQICKNNNRLFQVFYGSNFEKDKREEAIYQIINDIILCMESGTIVILLNLDNIYQAFYDMLNQNYQILNGQKRCKVAIGSDSSKCIVDDDFKCILLVNSKDAKRMDAPLLNRFEKHFYDDFSNLTRDQQLLVEDLTDWMDKSSNVMHFTSKDMYPVLTFNQKQLNNSLTSLVLQAENIQFEDNKEKEEEILNFCKKQIVSLANHASVIRIRLTNESYKDQLDQFYNEYECHTDIMNMLIRLEANWKENLDFNEQDLGFNVVVYTYSNITTGFEDYQQELSLYPKNILIDGILSKDQLEKQLADYFNVDNKSQNLIVIADSSKNNSIMIISLCKSLINQQRNKYKIYAQKVSQVTKGYLPPQKNVVFIIRVYGVFNANICFGQGWKETFIDLSNGKANTQTHVDKFLNCTLSRLLRDPEMFKDILEISISNAVSLIRYQTTDKTFNFAHRLRLITDVIIKNTVVYDLIVRLFSEMLIRNENLDLFSSDWILKVVQNRDVMNQSLSFHSAVINYIKLLISKNISFIIFLLEDFNLIEALETKDCYNYKEESIIQPEQQLLIDNFEELFLKNYINNPPKSNYIIKMSNSQDKYPFFKYIIEKFELIKDLVLSQIKNIDENITHELLQIDQLKEQAYSYQDQIDQATKLDAKIELSLEQINQKSQQVDNLNLQIQERLDLIHFKYEDKLQDLNEQLLQGFKDHQVDGILGLNFDLFIRNLSSYLGEENGPYFYCKIFKILNIKRKSTPSEIYSIYLLYNSFISQVNFIQKQFQNYISTKNLFAEFCSNLYNLREEQLSSKNSMLSPKYLLSEAFILALYQNLLPTEEFLNRLNEHQSEYEDILQQVLSNLDFFNLKKSNKEISMLQFLIRYKQKVINKLPGLKTDEELMNIVLRAQNIESPVEKITIIIKLNMPHDRSNNKPENNVEEEKQDLDNYPAIGSLNEILDEEITSDFDDSDDYDVEADENLQYQNHKIVCDFIFTYLEDEFDQIPQNRLDTYMDFCISAIIDSFENIKRKPLLAHGILRKIIRQISEQNQGVFTEQAAVDYESLIQRNEIIQKLHNFFQKYRLNVETPIVIIICDLIEEVISETITDVNGNTIEIFINQINESLDTENPLLQRIIGVAYVRVMMKKISHNIIRSFNQNQLVPKTPLIDAFDEHFNQDQIEKIKPYIFYLFKLLNAQMDYNSLMERLLTRFGWMTCIIKQVQGNKRLFKVLNSEKKEHQIGIANNMLNQGAFEQAIQKAVKVPKLKLLMLQVCAQEFYLNNQPDRIGVTRHLQALYNPGDIRSNQIMTLLSQGPDFLNNLQERVFVGHKNLIGELLVYSLVNFIPCDNQMFFKHLLNSPTNINHIYFPFNVNTKYDFEYNQYFQRFERFARYACVACGEYFFVGDCGRLSNERSLNQQVNVGGRVCKCGRLVGHRSENNSRLVDIDRSHQNLNPENESTTSYIFYDPEMYDGMNVRGLNNLSRLIGSTIMHLIILGAILLSDENTQNQIQPIYAPEYQQAQNLTRAEYLLNTIMKLIRHNCEQLKQILNINDDRLKLLMEYVIQKVTNKAQNLNVQHLTQIATRRQFEAYFQDHCLPRFNDNFVEFFQNVQEENLNQDENMLMNEHNIEETFNYRELEKPQRKANMYPLLRLQGEITQQRFIQYIQTNRTSQGDFLLAISDQLENLETLSQFNHILSWFNYMQLKFDGKISYEDSLSCNIDTIIQRIITDQTEQKKAIELFDNFATAWNRVIQVADIRDGCEDIIIPDMRRNRLFQLCCCTNEKKDSLGINFYYVLNYLSDLQNTFLRQIAMIQGYNFLNDQYNNHVRFTELKQYQIISEIFDEENLLRELKQVSLNKIIYGQGRNVEYNIEKLAEKLFNNILKNKVIINSSEDGAPYNFNFENLTNPYNQYVEIQEAIPQITFAQPYQVIKNLKSFEDRYNLLKDLQTTLNFIQQTGGLPYKSLKLYMQSFKVQSSAVIDDGIQIQHVLDFYEKVEDSLQLKLVESANNNYKEDLRQQDQNEILEVVKDNQQMLHQSQTILGRFIIRQLCFSASMPANLELFNTLFGEYNQYLFGIGSNIDIEVYQRAYRKVYARVGQSYNAYRYFADTIRDQKQSEEQKNRQKEEAQRRNMEKIKQVNSAQAAEGGDQEHDQNILEAIQGVGAGANFLDLDDFNSSEDEMNSSLTNKTNLQSKNKKNGAKKQVVGNNRFQNILMMNQQPPRYPQRKR